MTTHEVYEKLARELIVDLKADSATAFAILVALIEGKIEAIYAAAGQPSRKETFH